MKKVVCIVALGIVCSFYFAGHIFAEDVTILTYYPSPRGIYQDLWVYERIGRNEQSIFLSSTGDTSTYINLGFESTAGSASVSSSYCAILGGYQNSTSGLASLICGGNANSMYGNYSIIVGGQNNSVDSVGYAFIGGGLTNTVGGDYSFIGGGRENSIKADADYGTIPGGYQNVVNGDSSVVGGGSNNTVRNSSTYPPNYTTIKGGVSNAILVGGNYTDYSTIGGGYQNTIDGSYSTIGGGSNNSVDSNTADAYMAIGGGYQNSIENNYSVIMGGSRNSITNASNADGNVSVIGGGNYNTTACAYSFMGGGAYNKIGGDSTSYDGTSQCNVIVGGYYNAVERDNLDCFIGGGRQNTIEGLLDNGNYYSSIVGGRGNAIGDPSHSGTDPGCQWAFIGGGYNNTISRYADNSVIVGGYLNTIAGSPGDPSTACFIGGGSQNTITNTEYSSILGGFKNTIENCDSGHSCIVGGYDNSISGASYSVAMGRHALVDDFASFCWNSDDSIRESDGDYSFSVHCEWAHFSSFSSLGGSSSEENNWNTDFAELIPIGEKDIAEGDLVATKYPAKLGKTAEAYDPDLIGLVSSDRTRLIMMKCAKANKENSRYIALVGVVFCNVCDEGGPIALGDPITASSIPGVGMKADKACKIVGYAMDNFTEKRGEVLIFCNVGYYIPPEEYLELEASIEELEAYAKNQ